MTCLHESVYQQNPIMECESVVGLEFGEYPNKGSQKQGKVITNKVSPGSECISISLLLLTLSLVSGLDSVVQLFTQIRDRNSIVICRNPCCV